MIMSSRVDVNNKETIKMMMYAGADEGTGNNMTSNIMQNVTNYYFRGSASSWVSWQGMQFPSAGGDSSCSWVLVCALGHNLGQE